MTSPKTKTVHHPTFKGVKREVPEAEVSKWKDAGWRLSEPTSTKPVGKA